MRVRIQAYGPSRSARRLMNGLNDLGTLGNVRRLARAERSAFVARPEDIIVNWGSATSRFNEDQYLNKPSKIMNASNKLKSFQLMTGHANVPDWTTSKQDALSWLEQGKVVYARTSVSGHSGSGIVIMRGVDELVDAPLYTKKVNADDEYRIHVCKVADGDYIVFDQQQKKRRSRDDGEVASLEIRNHSNGWIFARHNLCVPERVQVEAINALEALGLDFGGVDVAYSREDRQAYVYEVNTACGIEGSSIGKYCEMINNMIERKTNG